MAGNRNLAEEIRENSSREFADSNDAHEDLLYMHEVIDATQDWARGMAEKIREAPGITNDYAEVADEASASLGGIAEELQATIKGIVPS